MMTALKGRFTPSVSQRRGGHDESDGVSSSCSLDVGLYVGWQEPVVVRNSAAHEVWKCMSRKSVCQTRGEPDRRVQLEPVASDLRRKLASLSPLRDDHENLRRIICQ